MTQVRFLKVQGREWLWIGRTKINNIGIMWAFSNLFFFEKAFQCRKSVRRDEPRCFEQLSIRCRKFLGDHRLCAVLDLIKLAFVHFIGILVVTEHAWNLSQKRLWISFGSILKTTKTIHFLWTSHLALIWVLWTSRITNINFVVVRILPIFNGFFDNHRNRRCYIVAFVAIESVITRSKPTHLIWRAVINITAHFSALHICFSWQVPHVHIFNVWLL